MNRSRRHLFSRRLFYTDVPRMIVADPVEGRPVTLSGYPIVWNVLSTDRGGYKVKLLPGSARFAPEVHALLHHQWDAILGSTASNSLRLSPDNYGVKCEIDLPNTHLARDVAELVRRGDLSGMSFAMVDDPESEETTEDGVTIVNARSYLVDEVTVTAAPAFAQARVGINQPLNPPIEAQPVRVVAPVVIPSYSARNSQQLEVDRLRFEGLEIQLPKSSTRRRHVAAAN